MKVITDWRQFPAESRGGVLCVGNFDGVHVGHAKMLSMGRDEAKRRGRGGGAFTIMTFEPHPSVILRPGSIRLPITTLDQRKELLAAFDPDVLIMIPPTREFLGIEAEAFLREVVVQTLGAKVMVEGPTFTFGRGARGNVDLLQKHGVEIGIETIVVPTQEVVLSDLTVVNVSSSLTRWLIEQGRVRDAARCLGRPFSTRGKVVKGKQRGRELGFPTANLAMQQLAPAHGVYGGRALVDGKEFKAAISVGTNPTFDEKITTVEAFLLDFDGDLYDKIIEVHFDRWIREMITFGGVGPLVTQMKRDVAEARMNDLTI